VNLKAMTSRSVTLTHECSLDPLEQQHSDGTRELGQGVTQAANKYVALSHVNEYRLITFPLPSSFTQVPGFRPNAAAQEDQGSIHG
jgi:hypothetical protein